MKKNQDLNIGISNFILIAIAGFVVLFYFIGFSGLILSDDFSYSYFAHHLFHGTYTLTNDIFAHRFGVFIPTGILYQLFGVNDISTTCWPLLCFLLSGILIFWSFKNSNLPVAVYGLIISSLNFYPLFFSNKLFPDVIVSFFALASAFILFTYRQEKTNSLLGSFLFSISFMSGFLTKETMLYMLPFYGLVFIQDMFKKRNYFFWRTTFVILLLLLGVYFGLYNYYTGDFFYRFRVIQEGHYPFSYSYFDKPLGHVLRRITYEPLLLFVSTEIMIPFVLSLPMLFSLKGKDFLDLDTKEKFWSVLAIVLLGMFWFGSTSYKFYNPVSLNGRMFIMVVPVLSIVAGMTMAKAILNNRIYLVVSSLFLIAAGVSYWMFTIQLAVLYSLLFLLFLIFYLHAGYRKNTALESTFPVGLMMVLLLHPIYSMVKTERESFENEKEIVRTYLNGTEGKNVVLTDPLIRSGSLYFYKFIPNNHYFYLGYKQAGELKKIKADKYFILINPKNIQELTESGYTVPEYFSAPLPGWELVQKRGDVCLYEIADVNGILKYH